MALIVQIIFAGFLIIGSLIALIKDFKKLTDEKKKQPLMLIFELLPVTGLMLFIIGGVIFDNLLLRDIAIILVIVGIIFDSIRHWKSNSMIRKATQLGLALFIVVLYIFLYH